MVRRMNQETTEAGLALLRWYQDAGVDEATGTEAAALYAVAAETLELPQKQVSLKPSIPKPPTEEEVSAKLR